MIRRTFFIAALGICVLISGCGNENGPTSSGFNPKQAQTIPTSTLSDDTFGSDIAAAIAAVGDSITYGDGSAVGGYPALLQNMLLQQGKNVAVHNYGIPGEEAYQTHDRFRRVTAGMDFVLLMIGTNDLWTIGTSFDSQPIKHIEQMLDEALASEMIPIVSTILPQYNCLRDYNPLIIELNKDIYAAAAKRGVRVVDNYSAIIENGGGVLYADCVHPNDVGYEVIAQQFLNALLEYPLIRSH